MDSDDFSLIDIGHEDDSLLRNLPPDDAGGFACSPLVTAGSAASSRPPKTTMIKENVCFGETDCTLPDNNKENLNGSCNMKLGLSNLGMDRQKMKRSRRAGGYNLRKSLAWDKAFFTEEGVLSSLELSMISGTPSKLHGEDLPVIYEEPRTPMRTSTNPADLQTIQSKSFRKLPPRSIKEDKRTGEGSTLKQKSLASTTIKSKKLASAETAKKSGRKEGNSFNNLPPTPKSHKRLPTTSPAKPAAQKSKLPRMPVLKPESHFISTIATTSDASHLKRNCIASPAPSVQKHIVPKGSSNTRRTSNTPKSVSQRIPKPSKSSDQRTRKNRTNSGSQGQSSTNRQVSNVKEVTPSEVNAGKILSVGLEANDGTSKAAVSVHSNSGKTCIIGQSVQHQGAKPSGLRMPSPSLKFFSEPKVPMSTNSGQRNIQLGTTSQKAAGDRVPDLGPVHPCPVSSISHNLGATRNAIQSKILKANNDRVPDSSPIQPCSVSSINSLKIHDESVQLKNNESIVGVQGLFDEMPLEKICNNSLEEVSKHFKEHEHTFLSVESVNGKDNRSVSLIEGCQHNDTDLVKSSDVQILSPEQGQHDLSVLNKSLSLESEVQEYVIARNPVGGDCCLEMTNIIDGRKEIQELHCPSLVTDEVSQLYDGLSSKELLERNLSPEKAFEIDGVSDIKAEDKLDKPLVVRKAHLTSSQKIVETANRQQELQVLQCPLLLMDKAVQSDDGSTAENDAFLIAADEVKMIEPLPLEVADYTNETDLVGQNTDFELPVSPMACKSISQVDAVICDVELSFSPTQGLGYAVAELSTNGINQQQHNISDELASEPLVPDEVTPASLKSKLVSKDLVTFEDIKLRYRAELQLNLSPISVESLMPDEETSGSLENEQFKDLASIDDRDFSHQAGLQLNPSKCEDQTTEVPKLEDETMSKDLSETAEDSVISDCRELLDSNPMEMLSLPNKYEHQTAISPSINNAEASSLHSSVDSSLSLKASTDTTSGVDILETDYQMNEEPLNPSLDIEQVEDHNLLIESSSRNVKRLDQTTLKELQLSPRTSEDCNRGSADNCDIKVSSSPCQIKSSTVRTASKGESGDQVESANQLEVVHSIDNEESKITPKILKDGKNQPQLVIRPPGDVVPFSEEWLAAVEAAGEEILTLKTGAVQNSPPAKFSPEPGPWSPVKRKNNQGIGPYDCTKFTGQH